ncbi:MAG: AAA family ATPase [Roseimicrobium sp.]
MQSLPWDADAEKGVLSCFLQNPTTLLSDAEAHLPDVAFYHPANRLLYQVMKQFHNGGTHPVEYIALTAYLRDTHQLDAIGGPAMLSELLHFVPTPVHYGYYKGILRDKLQLREIITTCLDTAARAQDHQPDVAHFTIETCARFAKLEQTIAGQDDSREMIGWSIDELLNHESDPEENLLGNGWLRRGGAAIFVGPSGVGKSSASMQQDMCWALGREAFGIEPARPLRILTIQSENDMDDLHEMTEGVLAHMGITPEERQQLNERTRYLSWTAARGDIFLAKLRTAIRLFKPDLVRVDPLQGFAGCQIEDSQQIGNFLRAGLNSILVEHRCGLILAHHTPKPRQDVRMDRRALDFAYAGAGGAEITNWARAILAIEVKSEHEFAFHAAKRGRRIGWENAIGYSETTRYFRHATEPGQMHWEEITDEAVKRSLACPRKSKDAEKALMKHVPQVGSIEKKQLLHLAKEESGIGHNTLATDLTRLLNADNPQIFQYHEKRPDVRPLVRITRQKSSGE